MHLFPVRWWIDGWHLGLLCLQVWIASCMATLLQRSPRRGLILHPFGCHHVGNPRSPHNWPCELRDSGRPFILMSDGSHVPVETRAVASASNLWGSQNARGS